MNPHSVPNAILSYPGKPVNGGSNPRFYDFDDGVPRLVKWHPSPHGGKACYNELVAARLGQLIGAPILRGVVVYVPDNVIPAEHKAFGAKAGIHFAVTRMFGENFAPTRHYADIENSSELPAAAVLLAWLAVGDQETHNQYLQREMRDEHGRVKETKRFLLVDMGHMFGGGGWVASNVEAAHATHCLPGHMVDKLKADLLRPALDLLYTVSDADVSACFQDRPEEWGITDAEAASGAKRAIAARDNIEAIIRGGNPSAFA